VIPLVTRHEQSTRFPGPSITLTLLPLFNAAAFFLALYVMYRTETTLTWFALALAAVYLGLAARSKRDSGTRYKIHSFAARSNRIAFITIAIPFEAGSSVDHPSDGSLNRRCSYG